MLKDIVIITKETFTEALVSNKKLRNPKAVYDIYRNLLYVISDVSLVSNHYLVLDFSESYLQNSSWGEPIDKWRRFFNEDLEKLNESIKKYLLTLPYLAYEDDFGILDKYYNCKSYYGFVRDDYSIGFVSPTSSFLNITKLETKNKDNSRYLAKYKKIDLTTFENRKELQTILNSRNEELKIELLKLKEYIKNRYVLEDLI